MRLRPTCLASLTLLAIFASATNVSAAMPKDWPNPFKWMKNKAKNGPPVPPVPVLPPPVIHPPAPPVPHLPSPPPIPRPPVFHPPSPPVIHPPGLPNPPHIPAPPTSGPPSSGPPTSGPPSSDPVDPNPPSDPAGPGSSEPPTSGPPTSGPPTSGHVHLFRETRETITEPAKFEKVFVGNDKFGAPKYETREVQPERKILKRYKVCSCGTKISLD